MTEVGVKSPQQSTIDQPKQPDPSSQEQDQSHFAPQGPSGQPFPPPNFAFYTYPPTHPPPPPADGTNPDPNAPPAGNGEPIPYPPGMYPYVYHQPPPPGYMPVSMSGMPIPSAIIKPKRKQVKMACTNCAAACKRCDVNRPCERCIKYGLSDSCHDGIRKERKKGFKRGPYNKRKRPDEKEVQDWEAAQNSPNAEWTPGGAAPPFPPPQPPFPPPPEGYYPAFYALGPPPPGPGPQLIAVPHNGAHGDHPEGHPDGGIDPNQQNGENGQPPHGQPPFPHHPQFVYPHLPPGAYPHFGYPFPGPPPPHHPPSHQQQQQQPHPQAPQVQQQIQAIPQSQSLEDAQAHAQEQDQPDQAPSTQTDNQDSQQQAQQPSPNSTANHTGKKKRANGTVLEETAKEDEDEDEDPPTPPKKKRGRRPSDGDWSATSKRKLKTENGGARARRTTRRSQAQPIQEEEDGSTDLQMQPNAAQLTEMISDRDIVGSSENLEAQS